MREPIAVVKLSRGEVGYFDELTRIHLTLASPYATIFKGMNTSNIQMSVRAGRLQLTSGSFEPNAKPVKDVTKKEEVKKSIPKPEAKVETKAKPEETKAAEVKVEKAEVKKEEPKKAEKVEETKEVKKEEPKKVQPKKSEATTKKEETKKEEK